MILLLTQDTNFSILSPSKSDFSSILRVVGHSHFCYGLNNKKSLTPSLFYQLFNTGGGDMKFNILKLFLIVCLGLGLTGCCSSGPLRMDLMSSPGIYSEASIDPFADYSKVLESPQFDVLFATNRAPLQEGSKERFYENKRGDYLRLGQAKVMIADEGITWSDLRKFSVLKGSTKKFPLQVKEVNEFGILHTSYSRLEKAGSLPGADAASKEFANIINERLKISALKDIIIYIHGYKVNFDNPILIASEFSHYLANRGVFIAFAWPSTPKKNLAYFKDIETANYSARYLRLLIEYLHRNTDAEHINIIAYSMGTRVAIKTLHEIRLKYDYAGAEDLNDASRIGQIFFAGSDFDRGSFRNYFEDGILDVSDQLNIYLSGKDSALNLSRFLLRRKRLGQTSDSGMDPNVVEFLKNHTELAGIDVTEAEGSQRGNGHSYFRSSPWVSSDILLTLFLKVSPEKRELIQREDGIWTFPSDYIQSIKDEVAESRKE
jgi:esterase/lipase superfamily enzyme